MPQPLEQPLISDPSLETDPNNPSAPTPTNDDTKELILQLQRENYAREQAAAQRIRELEDKLLAGQQVQQQAPAEINNDEFWQKPAENLNQMISKQVAPLHDFIAEAKKAQDYTKLKSQYAHLDGFKVIEPLLDKYMTGADPTHANLQRAFQLAMGELAMTGKLNQPSQVPQNNQNQPANNNQPANVPKPQAHLRPSATPPVQPQDNKPTRRPLTEQERRVCREWGITEEEFWKNLEADMKVSNWKEKK